MEESIVALVVIYIVIQFFMFLISLVESMIDFGCFGHNKELKTAKTIYEHSDYNMTYCRILSFLINISCPAWNLGTLIYAVFYYLTRRGRDGRFTKRGIDKIIKGDKMKDEE